MQELLSLSLDDCHRQMPSVRYNPLHDPQAAERLCWLQPRPQPRPIIPTASRAQLVMPGQAQLPRARSMQMADGYAPAVQPRRSEQAYVAAAAPARQAYTDNVR